MRWRAFRGRVSTTARRHTLQTGGGFSAIRGITMKLPMFRVTNGFQPANLAACSARAQQATGDTPPRPSPLRNAWRRVLAAGRFVHLSLPASWIASTKS
jgi:hypothetical protein